MIKNLPAKAGDTRDACSFDPWVGKSPWSRKWQDTPIFLPGKSYGQRGLEGYSLWGHKESDMAEHTHTTHTYTQKIINIILKLKNQTKFRNP